MDLSQVSTEDLKAIQAKQWDKVSTAGLQAYQGQRQHLMQASQQAQNPQQIPDSADKAAQGGNPNAQPVSFMKQSSADNAIKMGGVDPNGSAAKMMRMASNQAETPQGAQQLATTLIPGSASALSQGAGLAGRMGTAAMVGGSTAVGMGDPSASVTDKLGQFLKGGAVGGVLQGAGEAAGKLGDYLMQRSVGMRRYNPGVGTELANQGVVGTKNMMTNQVGDKLTAEEENLQNIVKSVRGSADAQDIGDAISSRGNRFQLPSDGGVAPGMEGYAQKVKDAAGNFQSMGEGGELGAQDLLAVKRQGDWLGYTNSGNQATSLEAELGRAQADKARDLLSDLSDEATRKSLGKEKALILAKTALERPETIHQGNGSAAFFGRIPGQSLLESFVGQTGVQSSKALQSPNAQTAIERGLFNQGN